MSKIPFNNQLMDEFCIGGTCLTDRCVQEAIIFRLSCGLLQKVGLIYM